MIKFSHGHTHASFIPERGGMMTSLVVDGEEYLYQTEDFDTNSDAFCAWPFCFPIVGRLNREGKSEYLYDGQRYALDIHGFAHAMPWDVVSEQADEVTLSLKATDVTYEVYPFDFEVRLTYKLTDDGLMCYQQYFNHDTKVMPYYAGFHPYLRIDPQYDKADVILEYDTQTSFTYNDTLTDIVGTESAPHSPLSLLDPKTNERLLRMGENKSIALCFPDGRRVQLTAEGVEDPNLFPFIQLYHIEDEPFFCIEQWMGHPNAMNTVNGARLLQPGQSEQGVLSVQVSSAASA